MNRILLALVVIFISSSAHAKKDEFKFGGRIGLGVEQESESGTLEPQFELRFQATSPRQDGFKGVIELRADEDAREVSINDVFVDWRNKDKDMRVRVGRGKKTLGWEYEYPNSTRLQVNRSNVYKFLGERALVGRDYFASIVWIDRRNESEDDDGNRDIQTLTDSSWFDPADMIDASELWKYEIAVHLNEMSDAAVIASALYTPSSEWRFGAWLLGERSRAGVMVLGVWEATLSALFQSHGHRATIELFSGTDPYRSEIEWVYGTQKVYTFSAAKAEYGVYLARWNPYTLGSVLFKDSSHMTDRTLEGTVGLRYFLTAGLNVAGEGTLLSSVSRSDPTASSYSESQIKFMMRYFF